MGLFDSVDTFLGFAPAPSSPTPAAALAPDVAPTLALEHDTTGLGAASVLAATTTRHQSALASAPGWSTLQIQQDLNKLGASPPLATDGKAGPKTTAALKAFQTAHGLVADGKLGPKTEAAMIAAMGLGATPFASLPAVAPAFVAPSPSPPAPAFVPPGAGALDPLLGGKPPLPATPAATAPKKSPAKGIAYAGIGIAALGALLVKARG